jgi:hypothetical protein
MGEKESTGPDGFTSEERNLYLGAQQKVQELNSRLEERNSPQNFNVTSSEDSASKNRGTRGK